MRKNKNFCTEIFDFYLVSHFGKLTRTTIIVKRGKERRKLNSIGKIQGDNKKTQVINVKTQEKTQNSRKKTQNSREKLNFSALLGSL